MPIYKQALSIFVSGCVMVSVLGLDSCKKSQPAQPQSGPSQPGQQAPATTYAAPTPDQLYQLVAPIALFPDNLVAQVLAASTFPDQISAAYTWMQQNSNLKGQPLMEAANQQPWDASVKALTQFPDVLNQMATNLSWTSALGDAYYNLPQSVMNAVQVMRQRAYQSGNLKNTQQQNVTVQNQAPGLAPAPASSGSPEVTVVQPPPQTIIIQPAQPDVVYVPVYNPTVVYGAPVPVYPGYSTGDMIATSLISFGVGIAVGAAISGGGGCCGWGWNSWGCGWHNSTVVYNHNTYISNSNTFANRNNYYNRNVNNINTNNINRNNVNANNINRNNINRNNYNSNNRANNFNQSYSTPHFNQKYDQPQYRNDHQGNLGQNRQQRGGGTQPNFNQQGREGLNQNQGRGGNFNQNARSPERGYGQEASRGASKSAFSNYGQGGNTRTNSARGQQSLSGNRGGGGASRPEARGGGGGGGGGRRR